MTPVVALSDCRKQNKKKDGSKKNEAFRTGANGYHSRLTVEPFITPRLAAKCAPTDSSSPMLSVKKTELAEFQNFDHAIFGVLINRKMRHDREHSGTVKYSSYPIGYTNLSHSLKLWQANKILFYRQSVPKYCTALTIEHKHCYW